MDDSYLTIADEARAETKVKGSRFIAEACLVRSVEEAQAKLETVRKREYQANHHCYAWTVGRESDRQFKYSDDGEPSGTAGRPIYDVLSGADICDGLIVVTRYFGGTKLGTGGLVRAYSEVARLALDEAGRREFLITREFDFTLQFSQYDLWQKEIRQLEAEVVDSEFSDRVKLRLRVRLSRAEQLLAKFTELTSGKGVVEEVNTDSK